LVEALTTMGSALRKPVVITAIVAAVSIAALLLFDHTNLIVDRRPPQSPPGTTFHAVNDVGAVVTPSQPESPIKPALPGPAPVEHPPVRTN
jgi:hypothetical protein